MPGTQDPFRTGGGHLHDGNLYKKACDVFSAVKPCEETIQGEKSGGAQEKKKQTSD